MHYTTQRRRNTASLLTPLISLLLLLVMTSCFGKTGGKKKGSSTSLKEEDVPEITPGKLVLKRAGDTITIVNEGTGPVDLNKHYLTTKSLTVKDYDDKDLDAKNYRIAYVKPAGGKTSISGKTPVSMLMGAGSGIQIGGATAALLKAKEEVTFTVQLSDYTNVGSASMEFCLTDEQGKEIDKEKVDWKAKLKAFLQASFIINGSDHGLKLIADLANQTESEIELKSLSYHFKVFEGNKDEEFISEKVESNASKIAGKNKIQDCIYTKPILIEIGGNKVSAAQTQDALSRADLRGYLAITNQEGEVLGCTKQVVTISAPAGS